MIADKNGIPYSQFKALNPEIETTCMIGQKALIATEKPFLSVKVVKTETYDETIPYEKETTEDSSQYKGYTKTVQNGKEGHQQVTASVEYVDGYETSREILSTVVTEEPVTEKVVVGTKAKPAYNSGNRLPASVGNGTVSGNFLWPSVSNLNGEILESAQRELTLVAFDHWSGLTVMPESIASFVTPSAVCVGEVLNAAARLLQERSGSPVFTGYQSRNAALVKMQMEAVYDALREASIHLRAALVNFEGVGLRIGTSAAVTETKQGTALDLALLYCSCLEKAGLRPLMILEKDSAYAGCWLEEKAFQECVQEDVSLLFDCAEEESEEILLVDTAGAAEELRLDFADARRRAEQRAADSAAFRLSVDIRRARGIGIRPLFPEGSGTAEDSSPQPETLSAETEPLSRQQMWERRLLDLSLRNMLINFRATRRTLQLLVQDFSALEDALSAGIEFQIAGCPEEWAGSAAVGKNCKVFSEEVRAFSERLSLPAEDGERRYLSAVADLAAFLRDCKAIPETLTVFPALSERKAELSALCEAGRIRDREREELLRDFSEELLILDEPAVRSAWEEASQSWFLPRFSGQRKIIKSFRLLARQPRMVDRQSVEKILDRIALFQKSSQAVRAQQAFGEVFGSLWNGGAADWDKLESAFAAACGVQQRVSALTGSGEAARTILKNLAGICANPGGFHAETDAVLDRLPAHWAAVCRLEKELSELSGASFQGGAACLAEMSERQERWSGHLEQLRDWCNWIVVRERAAADGLGAAAGACQSGAVSASELEDAYFRGLYSACADWGMENEPALSDFHGAMFDNKIQRFRRACKEFEQLTRTELVAKLSARIPSPSAGAAASSEIGILQKAIRSGGRMLSIRRLFDSIPNLLRMLCPCMLMSPISVAQYIDPQYPPFDLVVFDEASQLPTCEAVGAIARGESVIVVGDPKQLPPTSFFASHQTETDQFETEDLESVLDDCLAISMPEEHLLWHYRSRHESLIAFSNMQYYENKLHTFPSPNDQETKVSLIHLDGCYDRGRSKQNRTEAEAVVAEILRRFADEKLRKDSIGVVTFSAVQQNLIEDLLWEAFDRNPQLEEWNNAAEEPVFVKNLENVQGDERDVILFSIGYGPDENGKVALNFGPLNREGGWRRLNVAVSRARKEMQVFSTLSPEQIDLSRTHSEGVAGLRAFLEFARRGKESLPVPVQSLTVRAEGFAEQVARRIRMMGYEVHTNIGCSAFKVDSFHSVRNGRLRESMLVSGITAPSFVKAAGKVLIFRGKAAGKKRVLLAGQHIFWYNKE